MIVYCKKFMEKVEEEISSLDSDKKIKYLDERINWLSNYKDILELILSFKYLDPYVICGENKQQIIDENKLKPGDWDDVHSIIPPKKLCFIFYPLYKKEIEKLITQYSKDKQDKRLKFLLTELEYIDKRVSDPDLYNHNVDPFKDFSLIEVAIEKRLSDIKSLIKGCQHLQNIIITITNDKDKQDQKPLETTEPKQGRAPLEAVQISKDNEDKFISEDSNTFKKSGDIWHISAYGVKDMITDIDGFLYIHKLLQSPHAKFPVEELWTAKKPIQENKNSEKYEKMSVGELSEYQLSTERRSNKTITKETVENIKDKIAKLREERKDADQMDDAEKVGNIDLDIDKLTQYYSNHVRRGRIKPEIPPRIEKARINVSRSIFRAIDKIGKKNPDLKTYLNKYINTGYTCFYSLPANKSEEIIFSL